MWIFTQHLQKSRNLSFPFQVLSVLTTMLLTLKQHKNHVDDHSTTWGGVIVLVVIYLQPLIFQDIYMRQYMQIFCFLKLRPKLVREILKQSGTVRSRMRNYYMLCLILLEANKSGILVHGLIEVLHISFVIIRLVIENEV